MDIEKKVREFSGFSVFNPMQQAVLSKDWKNKNLVVSAPTASGKTIIAELCALNSIISRKQKVVYTCPLRSLAHEHFSEFKKKYSQSLNVKAAISIGDFDSASSYLQNNDIIFSTYEKLDSLIRHRAEWLNNIGLLVLDEVHELDNNRGPTLEMLVTKLRFLNPKVQLLALSATIPNADEIAKWLHADLVQSDFRPVQLREGVLLDNEIHFSKQKEKLAEYESAGQLFALINDTLALKEKQALVFVNTRRHSEGVAKKLSSLTEKRLAEREKIFLEKQSVRILNVLEAPTEQCVSLSKLVKKGIAFHNAGLLQKQREIVEQLFKSNHLKVLVATPTLGAGINLPAFRVIIPSLYRYTAWGQQRIPVREYKQWAGRAGRPRFDSVGEAVLIARSQLEAEDLLENYVNGEIEDVSSRLGAEPVLRMHLLAAIANDFVFDLQSLEDFFGKTFFALQFGSLSGLFEKISELLLELQQMGFVKGNEKQFRATLLGKRVSELYLDPLSAHGLVFSLNRNLSDFGFLFAFASMFELFPLVSVPKKRETELWEKLQEFSGELSVDLQREMLSDPDLLKKFNTALLLRSWIEELPEQSIGKDFGVQPGILRGKLLICDWLAYSAFELSKLLGLQHNLPKLLLLRKRLKKGVRQELIPLCELRGIGRVRARRLWHSNIRNIAALKEAPISALSKLLGIETALKVKKQLGIAVEEKPSALEMDVKKQKALGEF